MHYDNKIAQFSQGAVVICLKQELEGAVGHVVRFHLSSQKEVVVEVAFADGQSIYLHTYNIELLSAFLGA